MWKNIGALAQKVLNPSDSDSEDKEYLGHDSYDDGEILLDSEFEQDTQPQVQQYANDDEDEGMVIFDTEDSMANDEVGWDDEEDFNFISDPSQELSLALPVSVQQQDPITSATTTTTAAAAAITTTNSASAVTVDKEWKNDYTNEPIQDDENGWNDDNDEDFGIETNHSHSYEEALLVESTSPQVRLPHRYEDPLLSPHTEGGWKEETDQMILDTSLWDQDLTFGDDTTRCNEEVVPLQETKFELNVMAETNGWGEDSLLDLDTSVMPRANIPTDVQLQTNATHTLEVEKEVQSQCLPTEINSDNDKDISFRVEMEQQLQEKTKECEKMQSALFEMQQLLQNQQRNMEELEILLVQDKENMQTTMEDQIAALAAEKQNFQSQLVAMTNEKENVQAKLEKQLATVQAEKESVQAILNDHLQLSAALDKGNVEMELTTTLRDLQSAHSELEVLRATTNQPVVAQAITDLLVQHEHDLQRQYHIIDSKSTIIRELEVTCKRLQDEKVSVATESLARQVVIQEQAESIALELLSVVEERDILGESLHSFEATIQELQKQIDETSMDQSQFVEKLADERGALQQELDDYITESESIKESLRETRLENGELLQQLEDLRFESKTLKHDLKKVKLENASLKAELEAVMKQHDSTDNQTVNEDWIIERKSLQDKIMELEETFALNNEKISELSERLEADYTLKIKEWEGKHESLTADLNTLQKQYDVVVSEKRLLFKQLEESQARLTLVQGELKVIEARQSNNLQMDSDMAALQEQLELAQNALEAKCEELAVLSASFEDLGLEKELLEDDLQEAQSQVGSLQEQFARVEQLEAALGLKEKELHNLLEQERAEVEAVRNEKSALQQDLENARVENATLIRQLNNLESALSVKDRELIDKDWQAAKIEELQMAKENAESGLLRAQSEVTRLRTELVHSHGSVSAEEEASLQTRAAELESLLLQKDQEAAESLEALKLELGSVKIDLKSQTDNSNTLSTQVEQLQRDTSSQISDLKNQLQQLTSTLEVKEQVLVEANAKISALSSLQLEKDLIESELKEKLSEIASLQKQSETAQHSLKDVFALRSRVDDLESMLVLKENEAAELLEQEQLHSITLDKSLQDLEAIKATLAKITEEKSVLKNQHDNLVSAMATTESLVKTMQATLASKNEEVQLVRSSSQDALEDLTLEKELLESDLKEALSELAAAQSAALSMDAIGSSGFQSQDAELQNQSSSQAKQMEGVSDQDLKTRDSLLEEMRREHDVLMSNLEATHAKYTNIQSELKEMREALMLKDQQIQDIVERECTDERLKTNFEALNAENTMLKEQVEQLLEANRHLNDINREELLNLERVQAERANLGKEIEKVQFENNALLEQIKQMQSGELRNPSMQEDVAQYTPEISTELEDLQLEKDLLEDDIKDLQIENAALRSHVQLLETQPERREDELDDLRLEKEILEDSLKELQSDNINLQNQLQELQSSLDNNQQKVQAVRDLQEEMQILRHRNKCLEEKLEQTKSCDAGLDGDVNQLISEVERMSATLLFEKNSHQSICVELDIVKAEFNKLKSDYENLSAALLSKEMELEELKQHESPDKAVENVVHVLTLEKTMLTEQLIELQCVVDSLQEKADIRAQEFVSKDDILVDRQCLLGADESSIVMSLQKEITELTDKYSLSEAQHKQGTLHLAALGKSLKRAETLADELRSQKQELELLVDQLREESRMATERLNSALAERDFAAEKCKAMETNHTSAIAALQRNMHEDTTRVAEAASKMTATISDLESEVQRYRETEEYTSFQFEELERSFREQREQSERTIAHLRNENASLEKGNSLRISHDATLEHALSERDQVEAECDLLKEQISNLQQAEAYYTESIAALEQRMEEESVRYENESCFLKNELANYQQRSSVDNEITDMRNERDKLRHDVLTYQNALEDMKRIKANDTSEITIELELERARLVEALQQCETIRAENEEMLVQFGLIKQQIDFSEDLIKNLQEENDRLRSQGQSTENGRVQNTVQLEDELQCVVSERDELARKAESVQSSKSGFDVNDEEAAEMMSTRNNELEQRIFELEVKCGDLCVDLESSKAQLESTEAALKAKERLQSFQVAISDLDSSTHHAPGNVARIVNESEKYIKKLEKELTDQDKVVLSLQGNVTELREHLVDLGDQKEMRDDLICNDGEISDLQNLIETIKSQSQDDTNKFEAELTYQRGIVSELQSAIAELENKLKDSEALFESQSETLVEKCADIKMLQERIEDLESKLSSNEEQLKRILATQSGAASANNLKAIDCMRSHVISLALALEQSETKRAHVLNRLVSERETHAHSLKCMSENVKRFYATMSFGDR